MTIIYTDGFNYCKLKKSKGKQLKLLLSSYKITDETDSGTKNSFFFIYIMKWYDNASKRNARYIKYDYTNRIWEGWEDFSNESYKATKTKAKQLSYTNSDWETSRIRTNI